MKGFKPPAAFKGRSEAKFQQKLREKHAKSRYLKTILPKAVKAGLVRDDQSPSERSETSGHFESVDDTRRRPKQQVSSASAVEKSDAPVERVKVWQGSSKPKGSQFTARGQPVMAHRLFKLTCKLEKELNPQRTERHEGGSGKHSGKWAGGQHAKGGHSSSSTAGQHHRSAGGRR